PSPGYSQLPFAGALADRHARRASGCWPGSTGQAWLPARSRERFPSAPYISSSFPKLVLAQDASPLVSLESGKVPCPLGRSRTIAGQDARLASGCWLGFAEWDWLPTGFHREVSKLYSLHLSSFPRLYLAQGQGTLPLLKSGKVPCPPF